jgi:secreted trypsin-like serine protease
MVFSAQVAPVCLADHNDGRSGQKCWISGWGSVVPSNQTITLADRKGVNELQQVDVAILDQAKCNKDYNPTVITPQMICAAAPGHDNCQGDNGGPLVCQDDFGTFKHVGVISWG